MGYRPHISSTVVKGGQGGSTRGAKGSQISQGRVLHVVLSQNDPYCKAPDMVNGVYYNPPTILTDETNIGRFPFAYPGAAHIKTLPLPGEIVTLEREAAPDALSDPSNRRTYWTNIVNIWNNPHHGGAPDTTQQVWEQTLLSGFPERKDINQLTANPGDTIIQGRLSQTIRLTGAKGALPIIDDSNNGQPAIIISNGQIKTKEGITTILEDINQDANSLYFLSNHKVPITPANTKRDSYNTPPTEANQYRGNQVVVNGGRLYFNAKEESILLSAKESVGLNAKTINLDGEEYMCLDADRIYLGVKARTSTESVKQPAVLGKQFEFWISQLLDTLTVLADAMKDASAVSGGPVTQLNTAGPVVKASIRSLKSRISRLQSKKVYIE
jgi:hypothetical protein